MIRRAFSILVASFAVLMGIGCQPNTAQENTSFHKTEVVDRTNGVRVQAWTDQESIGTADRVRVIVDIRWVDSVRVQLVQPDWENTQWTLISQSQSSTEYSHSIQDGYSFGSTTTFVLEPFLPGAYTIDSFEVRIRTDHNAEPILLLTEPFEIEVRSVLATQDDTELSPISGFIDPNQIQQHASNTVPVVIGVSISLVLVSGFTVWNLTRKGETFKSEPTVYELLDRVSKGKVNDDQQGYRTLYDALLKLDPRLQSTSEIRFMIDQCESARYSAVDKHLSDPQTMAKHTLELLGLSMGDAA